MTLTSTFNCTLQNLSSPVRCSLIASSQMSLNSCPDLDSNSMKTTSRISSCKIQFSTIESISVNCSFKNQHLLLSLKFFSSRITISHEACLDLEIVEIQVKITLDIEGSGTWETPLVMMSMKVLGRGLLKLRKTQTKNSYHANLERCCSNFQS